MVTQAELVRDVVLLGGKPEPPVPPHLLTTTAEGRRGVSLRFFFLEEFEKKLQSVGIPIISV